MLITISERVNWGRREIRAEFTLESSLKTFFWKANKTMEGKREHYIKNYVLLTEYG